MENKKIRIYKVWRLLKQKRHVPEVMGDGGQAGVCDEWQRFEAFYRWSLANGGYSDYGPYRIFCRIDNSNLDSGDPDYKESYAPENCRWMSFVGIERILDLRILAAYGREWKPIAEWREETGLSQHEIMTRLEQGWSLEEILTTPPGGKRKK